MMSEARCFRNDGYHANGLGKLLHYFIDANSWDEYFLSKATEIPLAKTFYPKKLPVNLPVLDASPEIERDLFWRFWDQAAIRRRKWKDIFAGALHSFLFDLKSDQHEQNNLIQQHPQVAAELQAALADWTSALMPAGRPGGRLRREQGWYDFDFPTTEASMAPRSLVREETAIASQCEGLALPPPSALDCPRKRSSDRSGKLKEPERSRSPAHPIHYDF